MLFRMKDEKAHQLEAELDKLQADGPAAWAKLPEELFTPAGFSEERAEATSYSNYSYWGSTFRAFFKNRVAVLLLVALIAVVAFAFLQPYLPGQARPQPLRCATPLTGIQYAIIAPGEKGFSAAPTPSARTCGPASGRAPAPACSSLCGGRDRGSWWASWRACCGAMSAGGFLFTELYNILDNVPPDPGVGPLFPSRQPQCPDAGPGHVHDGLDRHGAFCPQPDRHHPGPGLQSWHPVASAPPPRASCCAMLPYLVAW